MKIVAKLTTLILLAICFFLLSSAHTSAQTRASLTVGPLTVQPGAKASGTIQIPAGKDEATTIPISVIHGAQPGPTLALIAGNHGYEYTPIIALQRLLPSLDPKQLSGALILVHVANMPSFLKRTIYYSPADGKNLNRAYPGKADGSVSERIAYQITREVIERADYLLDIHCGDGNESLRPYSYWDVKAGGKEVVEKSKQLALAFGLERIVMDTERPIDPAQSVYCSTTATTRGKPAITVESGGMGSTDNESIERIERGVMSVMRHLKMIEGPPQPVEHRRPVDAGVFLEDRVPDQLPGRPPAVPGRRRIDVDVVPVVPDDLEPFLEAVERTAERILIDGRRKDTNQLGHGGECS